jgi:hypothetical protein
MHPDQPKKGLFCLDIAAFIGLGSLTGSKETPSATSPVPLPTLAVGDEISEQYFEKVRDRAWTDCKRAMRHRKFSEARSALDGVGYSV